MEKIFNYSNGEQVAPISNQYIDNLDPSIGLAYSRVPDSGQEDLDVALAGAKKAFPAWADLSIQERSEILLKIAREINLSLEPLARAESIDNGKPIGLARAVDIPRAAQNMSFFAQAITQFASESHNMGSLGFNYTLRDPLGVVGCISPWNLPLYLFTWKIAPALAMGNCVIAKPSELTPMTAYLFGKICQDAGLPSGVLNILHGRGERIGQKICEHPDIKAISFTGGTNTGKTIARTAAPLFKKLSLELGGKNPCLVFADCDFEKTLEQTVKAAFSNQGQICLCGSRIYCEESLFAEFKQAFVEKVKSIKIGDPLDAETSMGAVISQSHREKIGSYCDLARHEGGEILTGGQALSVEGRCAQGFFFEPTVITGLGQNCQLNQEEVFGPVVTLQSFSSEEEAIQLANDSQYGLSATIWTQHLQRAHRVAKKIDAGIIWVNSWLLRDLRTPFGGMKNSGVGREGGYEALRFFSEAKNVCIPYEF